MRRQGYGRFSVLIGALWIAFTAARTDTASADPETRHFKTLTLGNGTRVILYPDRRVPVVAVYVRHHVGSRHEPPGKSGLAHLLEHMTFRAPRPSHLWVVNVGAFSGHGSNATTSLDFTDYYVVDPAFKLKYALWGQRWRISETSRFLDAHDLKKELPIVKNERREHRETRPHSLGMEKMWNALFPDNHPFHNMVIGSHEDLDALSASDAQTFFDNWYGPGNCTIAVVGDFNPQEIEPLVEGYFGSVPARPIPPVSALPPVALGGETVIRHRDAHARRPRLIMAWHTPAINDPGDAEAALTAQIVSGLRASRMATEVPEAVWSEASQESHDGVSVFELAAEPRADVSLDVLKDKIDAMLSRLRTQPPTQREVERASRTLLLHSFQSMETFLSRARTLVTTVHHHGDIDPIDLAKKRYLGVTPEDIHAFIRKFLVPDKRVVLLSEPAHKGASR